MESTWSRRLSDLADEKTSWTGPQVRRLLQELLLVHRADVDRVRSFWVDEFGRLQRARDAALKAADDEWRRLWARREDDIARHLLTMRESVRLHVENHWDNMEWHLDRTVDECDEELRGVKAAMERKVEEKEKQLTRLRQLHADTAASLEEKEEQMSRVKDFLLLLKSSLEDKEEQKDRLQRLQRERPESERRRRRADEPAERPEPEREAGAGAEALRRRRRLHGVKSLVKGFVGHNARFTVSGARLKSDTDKEDQRREKEEEKEDKKENRGRRNLPAGKFS